MRVYTRALSVAQSGACEMARKRVCRCRCAGALHGISHMSYMELEQRVMEEQGGEINAGDVQDMIEMLRDGH